MELGFDVEFVDDGVGGLIDGAEWCGGECSPGPPFVAETVFGDG